MTQRDRAIHELVGRLEDAEVRLAELERENHGMRDYAADEAEEACWAIEEELEALTKSTARKENRLMIRSGLLVAVLLCLVAIATPQAYAAGREPGAPAFDSSGFLHVEYGCDYFAGAVLRMQSSPWIGGGLWSTTDFYQRRASTWLRCVVSSHAPNGHACYGEYEVAGSDNAITGWVRTSFRCM